MYTLADEEKVLQEVMHDAEQLALEEEEEEEEMDPPMEKGEEEEKGAEPGSPAALLDEFIARLGWWDGDGVESSIGADCTCSYCVDSSCSQF